MASKMIFAGDLCILVPFTTDIGGRSQILQDIEEI
jgi:hypothetical protein